MFYGEYGKGVLYKYYTLNINFGHIFIFCVHIVFSHYFHFCTRLKCLFCNCIICIKLLSNKCPTIEYLLMSILVIDKLLGITDIGICQELKGFLT